MPREYPNQVNPRIQSTLLMYVKKAFKKKRKMLTPPKVYYNLSSSQNQRPL